MITSRNNPFFTSILSNSSQRTISVLKRSRSLTERAAKQNLLFDTYRKAGAAYKPVTTSSLMSRIKSTMPSSGGRMSKISSFTGKGLIGAGAITGIGLGIASGISSYAQSLRRPPVVHTSRLRNTGQTNQYYNMGADPFAGVRFAGRKKNFM